jgi:2-dehydropantoate 2-reductase
VATRCSWTGVWLAQRIISSRRHYNGQAAEGRNVDTPQQIPFVERFPPRNLHKQISVPYLARAHEQDRWGVEDVEKPKQSTQEETIDTEAQMPPESDGEAEEIAKEPFFGVDSQGLALEPEDSMEEAAPAVDQTNSSPETTMAGDQTLSDNLDDLAERLMNEKKKALEDLPRSQEAVPQPDERGRWIPYDDMEAHEELRQTPSLSEHTGLELDTEFEPRTIHILGIGPTGKYIAHALAGLPEAPPVTLLMNRPLLMQQWHEEGARIQLLKRGKIDAKSNFKIESAANIQREMPGQRFPGFGNNLEHTAEPPHTIIESLIVTTEGYITVAALSAIKHRLRSSSTICFIQDGLGVANLVDSEVFPDPENRPNYMLGNMSHDLLSTERKFTLLERKPGKIFLTMAPRNLASTSSKRNPRRESSVIRRLDYGWTPNSKWLMRTLSRTPELSAIGLDQAKFYEMQLQKLAINSVIGPLSVMYDCFNDALLCNYQVSRSMKLLIRDISNILLRLPEVSKATKIEKRFSAETLERTIIGVLGKTGKNSTSMLQAVRKGERTDIDFYNGYLLNRAAELGIDCPHLEMMVAMVKGKQAMQSREKNSLIPFKV